MLWLYENEIVAPGENWLSVLRVRGQAGWEAWFIEKDANGWREIYFKRPTTTDQPSTK